MVNAERLTWVCQNGGLVSSEILFNFASVWARPSDSESPSFAKAAGTFVARKRGRQCAMDKKVEI